MKKIISIFMLVGLAGLGFGDLAAHVNPVAGSLCKGHTVPAAVRPFGMISPGPNTGPIADFGHWDRCSGYNYADDTIMGFSQTHLLGIGVPSYGCLSVMPVTGEAGLGSESEFSHDNEIAEPGYYQVKLDSFDVLAEMTCTKRVALYKFTFPESSSPRMLLDLNQGSDPSKGVVEQRSDRALQGNVYCVRRKKHNQYYQIQFSTPFASCTESEKGAVISWPEGAEKTIYVKLAISFVSTENAQLNLDAEMPGWDFDAVRAEARSEWNNELAKIELVDATEEQKNVFYTHLYFANWHPQLSSDVNGQYRAMSKPNTHGEVKTDPLGHYTSMPMWDVFRSQHPLLILTQRDIAKRMINTMLDDYDDFGALPKWKYAYIEHGGMIGRHAVPILLEAHRSGIEIDLPKAAQAGIDEGDKQMSGHYRSIGFDENTSKTVEWTYNDWSIAELAKAAGHNAEYDRFIQRSQNYKNLYNEEEGFLCPRDPKTKEWIHEDFDPRVGYKQFVEGNAWHYLFSIFHDVQGLANTLGGDEALVDKLDQLFAVEGHPDCPPDVMPESGNYAHSNEPCHHIPYLYNYVGKPWKTQKWVRFVSDIYTDGPHYGIDGNNDAGAISSWFVFSSMGFYPVTPGASEYVIGSPLYKKAVMHLDGGDLVIVANNNSKENKYIQSLTVNGNEWNKTFLPYDVIKNGGNLVFEMGPNPSKWGMGLEARPFSVSSKK
jgi:predicted alpha-1,2-mannosidase